MLRRKQPNRFKLFYYSHPYFVIFNILVIYNLILIALAALVMTYLMKGIEKDGVVMAINWASYLKNLEYCAVFTMNTGGIYDLAPNSVVIMKIILSILQMITFTGALIGLATSILQAMFDKRIHNIGKVKIKHHYVILDWSAVGANLIREISFMNGNKTIVVLSEKDRDQIQDEIDNLFLETGTSKKHLKIFVKQGNPASRKALKEINIDKAESIAILGASSWLNSSKQSDSTSFKILMTVLSISKKVNVVIETDDPEVSKNIHDLMEASNNLSETHISIFSRNTIVGHVLTKTAINADYADLYYSLLSFKGGSYYPIESNLSVKEALTRYSSCLPSFKYEDNLGKEHLFVSATKEFLVHKSLFKKKYSKEIKIEKKLATSEFNLFVIGENERSEAIKEAVSRFNNKKEGNINLKVLPSDVDIEKLFDDFKKTKGRKKVLILSDSNASEDNIDSNVFLSLIKIKANKELSKDVEVFAEIFEPTNRFSLESLNISGVIIANQIVAVYMAQLLCNEKAHKLYEDLLMPDVESKIAFEIRQGKELFGDATNEFASKGEFVNAVYNSSNEEYLPIGFIGEKEKTTIMGALGSTVGGVVNVTGKVLSGIGNVLTLSDTPEEMEHDFQNIKYLNKNLSKKEKIIIKPETTMIVVHNK